MARGRRRVTEDARQLAIRLAAATARRLEGYGLSAPPGRRPANLPHEAIVVMPARGEMLYRLLSSDEVRERDFFSNHEKDRPPMDGEPHVVHCGISMYEYVDQALLRANRFPLALAAVTLSAGRGVTLAKTYGVGHYTVWGQPSVLIETSTLVAHVPHNDE
jgi:hypothetical protein